MENSETGFFMVFVEGRQTPTVMHHTYGEAEKEAKRLALKNREKVFVLSSVKSFVLDDVREVDCRPDFEQFDAIETMGKKVECDCEACEQAREIKEALTDIAFYTSTTK